VLLFLMNFVGKLGSSVSNSSTQASIVEYCGFTISSLGNGIRLRTDTQNDKPVTWPRIETQDSNFFHRIGNNDTMTLKSFIANSVLNDFPSSIVYFYPCTETEFMEVLKELSRVFKTIGKSSSIWMTKIVVYWPSIKNSNESRIHWNSMKNLLRNGNDFKFPLNSEVFLLQDVRNQRVSLWEIYSFKTISKVQHVSMFFVNDSFQSSVDQFEINKYISNLTISTRRQNLTGVELAAVAQVIFHKLTSIRKQIYITLRNFQV